MTSKKSNPAINHELHKRVNRSRRQTREHHQYLYKNVLHENMETLLDSHYSVTLVEK
jgi:hypothetical protein